MSTKINHHLNITLRNKRLGSLLPGSSYIREFKKLYGFLLLLKNNTLATRFLLDHDNIFNCYCKPHLGKHLSGSSRTLGLALQANYLLLENLSH